MLTQNNSDQNDGWLARGISFFSHAPIPPSVRNGYHQITNLLTFDNFKLLLGLSMTASMAVGGYVLSEQFIGPRRAIDRESNENNALSPVNYAIYLIIILASGGAVWWRRFAQAESLSMRLSQNLCNTYGNLFSQPQQSNHIQIQQITQQMQQLQQLQDITPQQMQQPLQDLPPQQLQQMQQHIQHLLQQQIPQLPSSLALR